MCVCVCVCVCVCEWGQNLFNPIVDHNVDSYPSGTGVEVFSVLLISAFGLLISFFLLLARFSEIRRYFYTYTELAFSV